MANLLISPHCDDEALFSSFTLCKERDTIQVAVVFDGYVQVQRGHTDVTAVERRAETVAALKELCVSLPPIFAGLNDSIPDWTKVHEFFAFLRQNIDPVSIYIPKWEPDGHEQHNKVCDVAHSVWERGLIHYTTYTKEGKSESSFEVVPEPDWITGKLRALACYRSQIGVENCREHFMRGLHEYYA